MYLGIGSSDASSSATGGLPMLAPIEPRREHSSSRSHMVSSGAAMRSSRRVHAVLSPSNAPPTAAMCELAAIEPMYARTSFFAALHERSSISPASTHATTKAW